MYTNLEKLIINRPDPSLNVNSRQVEFDLRYFEYRSSLL